MAKGFKHGAGGGVIGINFDVVAYATEEELTAATPKENTIGVITSDKITTWAFSATEPTDPMEGMVWIFTGTDSNVKFNALKKNGVIVYPLKAKQYISGAFASKTAKSYQNGEWGIWWQGELYDNGEDYSFITGGWTETKVAWAGTEPNSYIKRPVNKIDLTNFNTLYFDGKLSTTGQSADYSYVGVWSAIATEHTTNRVAKVNNPNYDGITTMDISGLNGEYYVGCFYCRAASSANGSVNLRRMWLE